MESSNAVKILLAASVIAGAVLVSTKLIGSQDVLNASFTDENETLAEVRLEVAETSEERRRGLMYRKELGENRGMIFKYSEEGERSFWMKNTFIPLDIIFLDSNYTVINIEQAEPEPDTPETELASYRSEEPAKYVVELNQGFADRNGIEKGDRLEIEN